MLIDSSKLKDYIERMYIEGPLVNTETIKWGVEFCRAIDGQPDALANIRKNIELHLDMTRNEVYEDEYMKGFINGSIKTYEFVINLLKEEER